MPRKLKNAQAIINLIEKTSAYFNHADVTDRVGYQEGGHMLISLQEVSDYIRDHALGKDAPGLSKRDLDLAAGVLEKAGALLGRPDIAALPFAIRTTNVARGLKEAARYLRRR